MAQKVDIEEIKDWLKDDPEREAAIKLNAIIAYRKGVPVEHIAKVIGYTRNSIWYWHKNLMEKGLEEFVKSNRRGKQKILTDALKEKLKEVLDDFPLLYFDGLDADAEWTGALLRKYLKIHHNIHISVRTAQDWIRKVKG